MDKTIPTLEGAFFKLRDLTIEDAPALQRYADDRGVWLNLFEGFPSPFSMSDATAWCGGGSHAPGKGYMWGIELEGEIIGCMSIRQDEGWLRCNAEVGYWIGRPFWQRGITSGALKLVCNWAWASMPELTRLYAPIFLRNAGSQAVAKSCGFELEGTFKNSAIKAGEVIDRTQWALIRPNKPARAGWSEAFAADPDNADSNK